MFILKGINIWSMPASIVACTTLSGHACDCAVSKQLWIFMYSENSRGSLRYCPCSFVCHYWQWPILISCVMCYYLCVLRWLMRPILALNCLLQIEQERSEEESSVGDALALAFRCARFCSLRWFLLLLIHQLPFLWGLATLYDPVQSVPMTLLVCWSL